MKTIGVCNISYFDTDLYQKFKASVKSNNYQIRHYYWDNTPQNLGYAKGQNICIQGAYEDKCDYMLVSNADVELSPNFIDDILPLLEKNPDFLALSGCRADEVNRQLYEVTKDPIYLSETPQRGVNYDGDWAAFVFKRETIDLLKESDARAVTEGRMKRPIKGIFFDEEQWPVYWEDNVGKMRICVAGYKQGKINNSPFNHVVSYTSKIGKGNDARLNWAKNMMIYMELFGIQDINNEPWRGDKMPYTYFNW